MDLTINKNSGNWCILLVDDDPLMHTISDIALKNFEYDGRSLEILHAYSAEEAKEYLLGRDDIALAIIDVVMESENAGLQLVQYIRNTLCNRRIRLVMRTGQSDPVPEEDAVRNLGIDDYRDKADLGVQKLRTLLYSKLRSYRDLCLIEDQRDGLAKVLGVIGLVQRAKGFSGFFEMVSKNFVDHFKISPSNIHIFISKPNPFLQNLSLADFEGCPYAEKTRSELPKVVTDRLDASLRELTSKRFDDAFVMFSGGGKGRTALVYLGFCQELSLIDRQVLEIYTNSVSATFDNLNLQESLIDTENELVLTLAKAIKNRDDVFGPFINKMSNVGGHLARLAGLTEEQANLIRMATPLYDVARPVVLSGSTDEKLVYGLDVLKSSNHLLMKMGVEIAQSHFERWDGKGLPNGLPGDKSPIAGRITSLAHDFCKYAAGQDESTPWTQSMIVDALKAERGKKFDPQLVDLLLKNIDEFFPLVAH